MTDLSMLQDFITETREHLEEMEGNLLKLENAPADKDILNDIFRSAHTTKSSSEYMGLKKIAELSHTLESLLEKLRYGDLAADKIIVDTLIESRDILEKLVNDLENEGKERTAIDDIIGRLNTMVDPGARPEGAGEIKIEIQSNHTDRILSLYSSLKVRLYQMTGGDTSEEKKKEITGLLDELLDMAVMNKKEAFVELIEKMKQQTASISYHDDAGDLLLKLQDIKKFIPELHNAKINTIDADATNDNDRTDPSANRYKYEEAAGSEQEIELSNGNILPDGEVYEEEYDEELFGIFIQHLEEGMEAIHTTAKEICTTKNIRDGLSECLKHISSLRSSANYMDYRKLTALYEDWMDDIKKNTERLAAGEEIYPADFIDKSINAYIKKITLLFPKYNDRLKEACPVIEKEDATAFADTLSIHDPVDGADEIEMLPDDILPLTDMEDAGIRQEPAIPLYLHGMGLTAGSETHAGDGKLIPTEHTKNGGEMPGIPLHLNGMGIVGGMDISAGTVPPAKSGDAYSELIEDLDVTFETSGSVETVDIELEIFGEEIEDRLVAGNDPASRNDDAFKKPASKKTNENINDKKPDVSPETKKDFPPPTSTTPEESKNPFDEGLQKYEFQKDIPNDTQVKHTLRVDAKKIDTLMNQVGELVVNRAFFSQISNEMRELQQNISADEHINPQALKDMRTLGLRLGEATVGLGRVANDIQEGVMKVRMLPISQLFTRYPRLVRDLVQGTEKKVNLEISGEETELDKMVIEEIADPLVHIIRNAVDHGCETITDRRYVGKPETCTIRLDSYHESNHVVIEVEDDGKGIDPKVIKAVAKNKNMFEADEVDRMPDKELMALIMEPGFSTASKVTTTSGRGVGMDVVKKNIMKLNGTIEVDSKTGVGTRIRIKIPLTMAIIQALMVRVGKEIFTIPLSAVEETIKISEADVSIIEGVEVTHLRNLTLTLLRLSEVFNIDPEVDDASIAHIVIVNTGMKRMGLIVDAMVGQEEAVIKPLIDYLQEDSGFSGATILGDGYISLILDVYELYNLSVEAQKNRRN